MKLLSTILLFVVTADVSAGEPLRKIAFGSCAMQTMQQTIWDMVAMQHPDLFLFVGDAIYADYDGKKAYTPTEATLERDWAALADEPHFNAFRKQVPIMATWDNHDYGKHDGGVEFELKDLTKKYFLDFFAEPDDTERRRTPGIYDAKIIGPEGKRVQVLLLDTRSFKTMPELAKRPDGAVGSLGKFASNNNPDASLLGDAQWRWLEEQLQKPAEVRLLVSSTQVIADQKGMEEWGNYPLERERLFALLEKSNVESLVILSGNVHFAEISKVDTGGHELLEFTSSGLTHTNKVYASVGNKYRIAGPYDEINFGLVEIDWNAVPSPLIHLTAMDANNKPAFEYAVPCWVCVDSGSNAKR